MQIIIIICMETQTQRDSEIDIYDAQGEGCTDDDDLFYHWVIHCTNLHQGIISSTVTLIIITNLCKRHS